ITTLIVGGLATDYCVKTTVLQLLRAGFRVIVNLAACRGISADSTRQALATMSQQGAVLIDSSSELKSGSIR
ncbi:MAG TPA: isochorismatase family protein, partial [Geoalkalibacter subterraneus]|nr:isochorismatase family protein [Geoalkalibacter subterraneus]